MVQNALRPRSAGNFRLCLWVLLITFTVLSPVLKNEFINWDDNAHIFENPHLNKPLPQAIGYFFGPHFFIGNYIPVTMTVFKLAYAFDGLNATVFHALNLIIHLVNVLLVFRLIFLLSGRDKWVAAFVALFFGIHPMHVESVAWISELKDMLYSLFFLAGLLVYYKSLQHVRPNIRSRTAVLILFLFSLLSKPAAVIFPFVLLLLDYFHGRKLTRAVWLEKVPHFLIAVGFGLLAVYAQQKDGLIVMDYPFWQRIIFASHSLIVYILKFIVPFKLSIFYPYPELSGGELPLTYLLSLPAVLLLFYLVYRARKSKYVVFGSLFFLSTIVLVLQLMPAGYAIMAERYTYLPYIGLLFIVGMYFRRQLTTRRTASQLHVALALVVALLAGGAAIGSFQRAKIWRNDVTLADDLLDKYPENPLALNNKGFIFYQQSNHHAAIPLLKKAVALQPDYSRAYINLANAYLAVEQADQALQVIDLALRECADNHFLYNLRGQLMTSRRDFYEAIKMYEVSRKINPADLRSLAALAECYFNLGDYGRAISLLDELLSQSPQDSYALNSKGYLFYLQGRYEEAAALFEESLKITPDNSIATANLINCRKAMGM